MMNNSYVNINMDINYVKVIKKMDNKHSKALMDINKYKKIINHGTITPSNPNSTCELTQIGGDDHR